MEIRIGGHMIHKMFFMHYYYRGCAHGHNKLPKMKRSFT